MSVPALSLIIAVYNRPEALEMIFTALIRQTFSDFEAVVADDGSGPAVRAMIDSWQKRFRYPIVHVWHEDKGFRKTVIINRAVVVSAGEYLVFIDGDCIPHRLFLQDHYERRETGAVLAGRRLMMGKAASARFGLDDVTSGRYENALRWVLRDEKHTLQYAFRLPWIDRIRNRRRSDYFVLGSNFSLYREDFLSVNGYDERIVGRGMEDNNLHARFCAAGMPVRSLSQAGLQYHLHHAADPIPHSAEVVRQFCTVTDGRTPFGIVRKEQC